MPVTRDEDIAKLLTSARSIAMVGASDRANRPSHGVMRILQRHGYRVFPVNPQITGEHIHGEYVWRELSQIGERIDIVDIFRNSDAAGEAAARTSAGGATAGWAAAGAIHRAPAPPAGAAGPRWGRG